MILKLPNQCNFIKLCSSPPWKNYYNPPSSPEKVQRVRIRSTNVSPGQYKYSPENDKSSPSSSFDDSLRQ